MGIFNSILCQKKKTSKVRSFVNPVRDMKLVSLKNSQEDTKHHIRKYWGAPFNVRNISLNQMRRYNRDILFPSLRGFQAFWFTFLEATIICPHLCSTVAWMYEFYKSWSQRNILGTKMIAEWNWKPREALEHV